MARGTDVHPYYQRGLRWDLVSDLAFVWVKASDGIAAYTKTDGGVTYRPDTHVAGAKSRGIPVGVYHYAQPTSGAEVQADVLVREARRLGATDVSPMLDLEAPFKPDSTAKAFGFAFCKRVAAAGFRPAVYMSASFAAVLRPDQWDVPGLVIVIARYGARPEVAGSGRYTGRYDVHQYSSSGTLPGSAGLVDLDESYTSAHLTEGNDDMTPDQAAIIARLGRLFPDIDDTAISDRQGHNAGSLTNALHSTWEQLFWQTTPALEGLAAVLAEATTNPDITLDAVKQIVTDAVKQNIEISGEVHIGPATE